VDRRVAEKEFVTKTLKCRRNMAVGARNVMEMHERLTRGGEIQQELDKLYAELGKFSDPTPADNPHEYELEEVEAFERIRRQIRALEKELREITG
jgi:hypothetical protein